MFDNCSSLGTIYIPNSVTSIGDYAFRACSSLANIIIPDSVTSIGWGAFTYCTGLASVTIPDSVTSIGRTAFLGCDAIQTIYYGGTEEQWEQLTNRPSVVSGGHIYYNQKTAIKQDIYDYHDNSKQNKTDNALTTTSKTVVGAINELKSDVNTNTDDITDLFTQKQDKSDPFLQTNSKNVVGAINELNTNKQDNIAEVQNNTIIFNDKKVVFPQAPITDSPPENPGDLTTKSYVDSADTNLQQQIDAIVSSHYTKSETDTLLQGKADKDAFEELDYAFGQHVANTNNPHSVTKAQVGLGNVDNTSDLNKPISTATQTALNTKANSADVYTKTETDDLLDNKENIIRDITPYIDYTVYNQTNEVTITNLKSGVTPSSLVGRFRIPSSIEGKTVTTIGQGCFTNCINADFILPSTLKVIGNTTGDSHSTGAFCNTNISNISLNAGVFVGIGAFKDCRNIQSLYIPDNCTLGGWCFYGCSNLSRVEFSDNVIFTQFCFYGCSNLKVINIPEGVNVIWGQSIFNNCISLKKIYLPKTVTSLGTNTFANVVLTDLYFGGTQTEWNDAAHNTIYMIMVVRNRTN